MKKILLSFAFVMLVSVFSFANTPEAKVVLPESVEAVTIPQSTVEDGWWMCIISSTSTETNPLSGETTTTTTYICYWMEL